MPLKAPSLRLWHNLGVPCWEQTEASIWFMVCIRSGNGVWLYHTYLFVCNALCMKIREWLYHIPWSKLVPLQFLGKRDEDNTSQYYDGHNASITMADVVAKAQLQWDVHNASLAIYTMMFLKPESHTGHDIIQMSIILSAYQISESQSQPIYSSVCEK